MILIFTFIHVCAFIERVFSINSDIISENITVGRLSPSEKNCGLLHWKPFKSDEKCILFHLKSCFRSQYIWFYIIIFWSCRKNCFDQKDKNNFKNHDVTARLTNNCIQILSNISESKSKQTMKLSQKTLTREIFFFENYAENQAGRLLPDFFCCFLNMLNMRLKQVVCNIVLIYFDSHQLRIQ